MSKRPSALGRLPIALVFVALALTAVACGGGGEEKRAGQNGTPYAPAIDPAQFTDQITNRYFPLTPGTAYVYEGTADGDPERTEVVVTYDTKVVMGVRCVVVRDTVTRNGELVEDTFDWYAQDAAGNVWYFGEDTKEYENGEVKSTQGSWEGGLNGAQPGIVMLAEPRVGETYRQEYFQGEAEDMGKVLMLGDSITVPAGSYSDVLVTEDTTPLEPDLVEHKYYAPGVGFVYSILVEGGQEEESLVSIVTE